MEIERRIANEIMDTVHRLGLPLKLDQITEGQGNCFPISIKQQLNRPEIYNQLKQHPKQLARHRRGHAILRHRVKEFITLSDNNKIRQFKSEYRRHVQSQNGET